MLDLGAVDLDRVEVRGKRDRDALRSSAELAERLADERLDRPQLGFRLGRTELEAREVEEVRDQTIEAPRLGVDRGEQARAVLVAELQVGALEPVGRGSDRGQRRAQVVADRAQDRGLDRIAAPKRFGVDRPAAESLAVDRDRQQRGERSREAARELGVGLGLHEEPAHVPVPGSQVERRLAALGTANRVQLDPRSRDSECLGDPIRDASELALHVLAFEQRPGDLGQERCLERAIVRLLLASP